MAGVGRLTFSREIVRDPSRTTRTVKVLLEWMRMPFKVSLCASSDNNNRVFVDGPFEREALRVAVETEIKLLLLRDGAS